MEKLAILEKSGIPKSEMTNLIGVLKTNTGFRYKFVTDPKVLEGIKTEGVFREELLW